MEKRNLALLLSVVVFVVCVFVSGPSIYGDILSVVNHRSSGKDPITCDLPSTHKPVSLQQSSSLAVVSSQNPSQEPPLDNSFDDFSTAPVQQQETEKHCENKDAPSGGKVDAEKIGCKCARKCVNGQPTENYENGKRCEVHCKPDHCECPNPCAKT